MDAQTLKAVQGPLKEKYRDDARAARITLRAEGRVGENVSCSVNTGRSMLAAGLHPASGGDGSLACSGDMLLEALVACAGVTMSAVATSLGFDIGAAQVTAEGDLDFRGTLGVDKLAPVGISAIRLHFRVGGDLSGEQRATLLKLTERYCVVLQTLRTPASISVDANPG